MKSGQKPVTRAGLLKRYLGTRTSVRTKRIVSSNRSVERRAASYYATSCLLPKWPPTPRGTLLISSPIP